MTDWTIASLCPSTGIRFTNVRDAKLENSRFIGVPVDMEMHNSQVHLEGVTSVAKAADDDTH